MQPQGTAPINAEFFDNLSEAVEMCNVCAQLQAQVNMIMADLQAYMDGITSQLIVLGPLLELLEVPTSPDAVVTWVGKFINLFMHPYLRPYNIFIAQITELTASIANLVATIESVSSQIENCTITVPPVVPNIPIPLPIIIVD